MSKLVKTFYQRYLTDISFQNSLDRKKIILITHILFDQIEYFNVISKFMDINCIIAIPYSLDQKVLTTLKNHYKILTPTFGQLLNPNYLANILYEATNKATTPIIIQEIGGYFAGTLPYLDAKLIQNIIGIVEDTETGHRRYESLKNLTFPIISVARSSLKKIEDNLVGGSCLFSTEKLIRHLGLRVEGNQAAVIGYGKIGLGLAHALQRRSCAVSVYDINPIRHLQALSAGFAALEKNTALAKANLIFGATGYCSIQPNELKYIKDGAFLVSCSSKYNEFPLEIIYQNYKVTEVCPHVKKCTSPTQMFYILGDGQPVNFIDGSAIGPVLALTHAEMLTAILQLASSKCKPGLQEIREETRKKLAEEWKKYFLDPQTGHYRYE